MNGEKVRYRGIDTLRVVSMICIVLMHFKANCPYQFDGFFFGQFVPSFADLVLLFMVISCFSVCCGYYERFTANTVTLGEFYSRRFARVWPFFAVLCVIDVVLSPSVGSLYEAFANMTLCHGFLDADISVIGVGWFLGTLFVFYFVFPFICWLLQKKWRAWLAFAAALGLNIACERYFHIGKRNFGYSAVFFMAGGLIYLYREPLKRFAKKYWAGILFACLGLEVIRYGVWAGSIIKLAVYSLLLILALGNSIGGGYSYHLLLKLPEHGDVPVPQRHLQTA